MPTLHVRSVPDELYEALKKRALAEGRSISSEAIFILERELKKPYKSVEELLMKIKETRKRYKPAKRMDSAEKLIREDRRR
ncbi:MAG TPA: Arc family DNA-binding protein [Candidatus Omnitrophica bacterium]|nr:Arc family DNA-binding protein [Candidatus Omnitrophota bacterium]